MAKNGRSAADKLQDRVKEGVHQKFLGFCRSRDGRGAVVPSQFLEADLKASGYANPKSAALAFRSYAERDRYVVAVGSKPETYDFHPALLAEAGLGQSSASDSAAPQESPKKRRQKVTKESKSESPKTQDHDPVARGNRMAVLLTELTGLETEQLADFERLFAQMRPEVQQRFLQGRPPQQLGRALNAQKAERKAKEEESKKT